MKLKFFARMMMMAATALTLFSCSIDDDNYADVPQNSVAYGIIANVSPSSGDLYFFADSNQVNNSALAYGTAAGYYNFYTGNRVLSLKNAAGTVLDTVSVSLNAGDVFSAFAVNTYDNIELVTYNDSLVQPETGHARVRFINLSPDAGSIDISGLTQSFATGVDFKEATDFISVQSGTYDITFKNSAGETLYISTAEEFYSGGIYTIYTKGYATPPAASNDTFSTKKLRNY